MITNFGLHLVRIDLSDETTQHHYHEESDEFFSSSSKMKKMMEYNFQKIILTLVKISYS